MQKGRVEAFSDGVIAIILTIMVLEFKVPHEVSFLGLLNLAPIFLSYVISFIYVGIYWNNHHHLFHTVKKIDGPVLWANLFLLFWLSLIPFASHWMGENNFKDVTVTLYGVVLFGCALAYYILTNRLLKGDAMLAILFSKSCSQLFIEFIKQSLFQCSCYNVFCENFGCAIRCDVVACPKRSKIFMKRNFSLVI